MLSRRPLPRGTGGSAQWQGGRWRWRSTALRRTRRSSAGCGWHSPIASRSARGRSPTAVAGGCERKPVPSSCAPTRTARGPTASAHAGADRGRADGRRARGVRRGAWLGAAERPARGRPAPTCCRRPPTPHRGRSAARHPFRPAAEHPQRTGRAAPSRRARRAPTRPDAVARRIDLEHPAGAAAPVAIRGAPRAARGPGHGGDTRS